MIKVKLKKNKKCECWRKGHWFVKYMDTCLGTKEEEPCDCGGDVNKCNFYPEKKNKK